MIIQSIRRFALGAAILFGVAACGGGGGGGAADGSATPAGDATSTAEAGGLAVSLQSPAVVQSSHFGSPAPAVVHIGFSGDLAALTGKTLFMFVEMPDRLYDGRPVVDIDPNAPAVTVTLGALNPIIPAAGRYTGVMKVHACLDTACATELRNSPLSVPYDIEVRKELTLSQSSIVLSTPFGTVPDPVEVDIFLPEGARDLDFTGFSPSVMPATLRGNKLVLAPSPSAQPGTYKEEYVVFASAPDDRMPSGFLPMSAKLDVQYTVLPSDVPFFLSPALASHTFSLSDRKQPSGFFSVVLQGQGFAASVVGIRYDSDPPAAEGHPQVKRWMGSPSLGQYFLQPCSVTFDTPPQCLPPGIYTAAVLARVTSPSGAVTNLEFAVTMNVVP